MIQGGPGARGWVAAVVKGGPRRVGPAGVLKRQNSRLSQVKGSVVAGAAKGWTLGWSERAKLSPFAGQGLQFAWLGIWWRGLPAVDGGRRGPAGSSLLGSGFGGGGSPQSMEAAGTPRWFRVVPEVAAGSPRWLRVVPEVDADTSRWCRVVPEVDADTPRWLRVVPEVDADTPR